MEKLKSNTIRLVKNGVFPITIGLDGNILDESPRTGYEFPGTLQGEGKLAGIPVLFIRTSGCNLRCTWMDTEGNVDICDTPYSSHYAGEFEDWSFDDILKILKLNLGNIGHIVISGGEPTIQPSIVGLASLLKKQLDVHITLETSGVHYLTELSTFIDFFSISPKLKSSEPDREKNKLIKTPVEDNYIRDHARFRRNIETIQKYINACMNLESYYGDDPGLMPERRTNKDFQLKFVVTREEDEIEIREDFLSHLNFVEKPDILIMSVGSNPGFLNNHQDIAARMAIRNGWRFSPRIQIDLFGDKAGT